MPRGLVVLLGLAGAVVVIAGMKAAASLIGPTFLALVITIAASPLHRGLDRRLPSWAATVLSLVVVYGFILAFALALVGATARFATILPEYEAEFDHWVSQLGDQLQRVGVSTEQVNNLVSSVDLSRLTGVVTGAVAGVFGVLSNLVLLIMLLFFMSLDGSQFSRNFTSTAQARPFLVEALLNFSGATRRYLLVSTFFGGIVAVLDTIALWLMDIPAPVLWGLLAFLTNYIPNIGFFIGLVPPAVLALLSGGPGLMVAVIAVYCLLNALIQSGIQPKVVGDSVGLSTTLTFVSLVFWTWVIGPLGAILAIPFTLLTRALIVDADPQSRWLIPLVSNSKADENG